MMFCLSIPKLKAQIIDVSTSKVTFKVMNRGNEVSGNLLNMNGEVNFDPKDIDNSTFKATVDPATINTKSSGRDKHLQKDDFFGTNTFPLIHMSSKKIIKTEKGFMAIAELQIRDFKTEVKLPFKLSFNADNQQVLQGAFTLNRLDYNLGEQIGEQSVGFEVDIAIYCVVTI